MCELMVVWSVSYSCCYPWLRGCPIIVFNVPIHPSCYVVLVEDQGVEVSERSGDNNAGCVRGGGRVVQVAEHRPVGSGQCTRVHHHNQQQVNHPLDTKERSLQLP